MITQLTQLIVDFLGRKWQIGLSWNFGNVLLFNVSFPELMKNVNLVIGAIVGILTAWGLIKKHFLAKPGPVHVDEEEKTEKEDT